MKKIYLAGYLGEHQALFGKRDSNGDDTFAERMTYKQAIKFAKYELESPTRKGIYKIVLVKIIK